MDLLAARKESWVEVKSPHFVVYSDAGEAEARKALLGFEGIRSVFGAAFQGIRVDPPKPMVIILAEDEASMKRFLPEPFQGKDPSRPAGVFIMRSDRNYAILRLDVDHQDNQPYFVLFHEYTHSIIHQNFPALPTWLDEGLADYYGATEIRSEQVYLGRVPRGRLDLLRSSVRLPLETLFSVTHDSPHYKEGEKTGIFYAQSWAFVHYLFMDEGARKAGVFRAYLKALDRGGDPPAAAQEAFGDLAKLGRTLSSYYNQPRFFFWNLPLAVKVLDKDFQARPIDEAGALVVRAEFLQYTQQEADARLLLSRALALAPQRAEVQAALGYGYFLQGEKEAARGAFLSAIQLGSKDFRPPYYLAILAQEGLGRGATGSAQILAWLEAVKTLCPDFPATHMALCRQYTWDPRDPAKAVEEGRMAVALDPKNLTNLVNLGHICMNLDLEKDAQAIGEALNRSATSSNDQMLAKAYEHSLAVFLEGRKVSAMAPSAVNHAPDPFPHTHAGSDVSIKFSLPSHLAPLGQEVMQLVSKGQLDEAIRKVEAALPKAHYDYDRKALRSLLKSLQARRAPQPGLQQPADPGKATLIPQDRSN
jgi:tetratricopeptide (TPR) repeat protein